MTFIALILFFATKGAFAQDAPSVNSPTLPPIVFGKPSSPPKPIRVGGPVMMASLIHQPFPIYPSEAKKAHIEGTVLLHAVIAKDGTISDLQYVSGPPMLMKAAMDAVQQWQYKPTLLNGEPVAVDTTISIVFTLGGNPPPESLPPLTHPAAARVGQAPFPHTLEGMKAQMETALKLGASEEKKGLADALDSFAMENPKVWLVQTFGAEAGGKLVGDYETSLTRFKEHITLVGGFWARSTTSRLLVEDSLVPKPPEGDEDSKPPHPLASLTIEDFRFNVETGQLDPGDWVFSFVYVDGAFRIVGGTFAFWDDNWSRQRDEKSMRSIENLRTVPAVNVGIEGVESLCPGDGLVRVFVSPKAAAARLKKHVEPIYPEDAKKAGIEGTVLFHAIIGADGSVKELELEDGDPALTKAAEAAVRQWKYEATMYYENTEGRNRPAEVDTAIAVQFKVPQ